METLIKHSRPRVEIDLAKQGSGFVPSYTTWDSIDGTATVEVDRDTDFDGVEITLEGWISIPIRYTSGTHQISGTVKTSLEHSSMPGLTEATQTLLKLRHQVDVTAYPTPRVLQPGRAYRFPFTFVVPDRLLPHMCKHPKPIGIEGSHTLLPPSLGDPMLAGNGKTLMDDMCSEMCRISYNVRVSVLQKSPVAGKTPKSLASVAKKVRIIPAVEEEPPLDVSDHNGIYWDRKEKDVRRGLMRGKFGHITAEASQPKAVQLLPPDCEPVDSVGTVATVKLRFDPVDGEEPPRLSTLSSNLRVSTYYTDRPLDVHPSEAITTYQPGRVTYIKSVPLSSLCVASASWTKHTATRRNSFESTASCQSSTSSNLSGTYYTSSIVVPISLPRDKAFVPSFESCLVSRFYALDLGLTYHTPATNVMKPSISLRIPIQLASQPKVDRGLHSLEDTKEEIDEIFHPRSVAPSPAYTELPGRGRGIMR